MQGWVRRVRFTAAWGLVFTAVLHGTGLVWLLLILILILLINDSRLIWLLLILILNFSVLAALRR
ncbi:hypothetical protein T484DRAFT_1765695, partial [Baffinella frigidus]